MLGFPKSLRVTRRSHGPQDLSRLMSLRRSALRSRSRSRRCTIKCNCSICSKMRNWGSSLKADAFRLIAGEEALSDYQFSSRRAHHIFCKHCGIRALMRADVPGMGGARVLIQVATLDDASPEELFSGPVR